PVKTVKGLLADTGIPISNQFLSIDGGRIAGRGIVGTTVFVYDVNSRTNVTFAGPPHTSLYPQIFGDRLVDAGNVTGPADPLMLFYCVLPHSTPVQSCGPWTRIVTGLPSLSLLGGFESVVAFKGDIAAWPITNGFSFYRFSTNTVTTIPTSTQVYSVTTNGQIISFAAKPTSTSPSRTIMYYDTTSRTPTVVDTGLPGEAPSIAQYTIAFNDNSTTASKLRYYDILRNQANPSQAGTGPTGSLTYTISSIWGDRIVYQIDEVSANFDCNGDGVKSSSEYCLGYWNIRPASYVATTLDPSAAPGIQFFPVIYDETVAFQGSNGNLQYVTVPMQGDVNLDGKVDGRDQNITLGCLGQVLKGTTC
ncbi:MAG TPA: hypothetical protein VNA15_05390, partial [Candidatus Angelobacter sp.]|nr:hypothetical protein [Candidatus Angelobacter sp.]